MMQEVSVSTGQSLQLDRWNTHTVSESVNVCARVSVCECECASVCVCECVCVPTEGVLLSMSPVQRSCVDVPHSVPHTLTHLRHLLQHTQLLEGGRNKGRM